MPRLIIIGAGISGLTAGIYAQRSGFQTLILEKCATPGGVSTCWTRKGFMFEGGVHWLTGSSDALPLHRVWKETGALQDNNPVYNKDPFFVLSDPDGTLPLYRHPDQMFQTLVQAAPEDASALRTLYRHIRWFRHFHQPITLLPGLKSSARRSFRLMEYVRMFPALLLALPLWNQSVQDYLHRFRNPRVRALLGGIMNPNHNALSFIATLSGFCHGDCGYPSGGSLLMAKNMADTFCRAGGEIRYNTEVQHLCQDTDTGAVTGVQLRKEMLPADAVLVTIDARKAIDRLFDRPLQAGWAQALRRRLETCQCMFIGIGVSTDLVDWPKTMVFSLPEPLQAAGLEYRHLTVHNYALDHYAPEGCSTLTILLLGNSYAYWHQARQDGTYRIKKEEVVSNLLAILYDCIPEVKGKVVVTNMATPVTVERYCDTHEGSYMAVWRKRSFPVLAPLRYRKGIYFAGQRTSLSGGLPIAAATGRKAAMYLCRDFGQAFVTEQAPI